MSIRNKILKLYLYDNKSEEDISKELSVDIKYIYSITKYIKRPNRSSGESKLLNVLKEIYPFVKIVEQYRINNTFFDFYIPSYKVLIEYDGIQHFKKNSLFHGSQISGYYLFEKELKNDKYKDKIAKDNNLVLIRIPYNIEINKNNIKEILHEHNKEIIDNLQI